MRPAVCFLTFRPCFCTLSSSNVVPQLAVTRIHDNGSHSHVIDELLESYPICLSTSLHSPSRCAGLRLLSSGSLLALLPPGSLLEQLVSSVGEESELAVLNAHEPVAEAAPDSGVDGVDPEGLLVEERAHLNAELP